MRVRTFAVTFFVCPAMLLGIAWLALSNESERGEWALRGIPREQDRQSAVGGYANQSCGKQAWLVQRNTVWVESDHEAG